MKEIEQLIEISQFYGRDSRYVIAGGGNTSYKNADRIWVKASGTSLATITENGFALLDRTKLRPMSEKKYSDDVALREEEVKNDLELPRLPGISARRWKLRCTILSNMLLLCICILRS